MTKSGKAHDKLLFIAPLQVGFLLISFLTWICSQSNVVHKPRTRKLFQRIYVPWCSVVRIFHNLCPTDFNEMQKEDQVHVRSPNITVS